MSSPHNVAQLLQVERDGNPLRRFGHASPFIGKLGPLQPHALNAIARATWNVLPPLPDPTLVIGMTESSLLLSWFLALWQDPPVDLRFTTRKTRGQTPGRAFQEPHSHGPQHFLALPSGALYAQILVIEDELTTGATLRNLLHTVRDVAPHVWVVTLSDMRPLELRQALQLEMQACGVMLQTLDVSELSAPTDVAEKPPLLDCAQMFNPFGRSAANREKAHRELREAWRELQPSALYPVGECVDVPLAFWAELPPDERPEVRQITRSPWRVDGNVVRSREEFSGDGTTSRYFLYNWAAPPTPRAVVIGEAFTRGIAQDALKFLRAHNIEARAVEVAPE